MAAIQETSISAQQKIAVRSDGHIATLPHLIESQNLIPVLEHRVFRPTTFEEGVEALANPEGQKTTYYFPHNQEKVNEFIEAIQGDPKSSLDQAVGQLLSLLPIESAILYSKTIDALTGLYQKVEANFGRVMPGIRIKTDVKTQSPKGAVNKEKKRARIELKVSSLMSQNGKPVAYIQDNLGLYPQPIKTAIDLDRLERVIKTDQNTKKSEETQETIGPTIEGESVEWSEAANAVIGQSGDHQGLHEYPEKVDESILGPVLLKLIPGLQENGTRKKVKIGYGAGALSASVLSVVKALVKAGEIKLAVFDQDGNMKVIDQSMKPRDRKEFDIAYELSEVNGEFVSPTVTGEVNTTITPYAQETKCANSYERSFNLNVKGQEIEYSNKRDLISGKIGFRRIK